MEAKTRNGLIVAGVVGIGVYFAYNSYKKQTLGGLTSKQNIVLKYLESTFGADTKHTDFVKSADKTYIGAWASAIKNGSSVFTYNGSVYNTAGGTKKI
jgi:hypothetical protein